jgi:hypothetical protein
MSKLLPFSNWLVSELRLDASQLGPGSLRAGQKLVLLGPSLARLDAPASRKTELGPSFPRAQCSSVQLASLVMVSH